MNNATASSGHFFFGFSRPYRGGMNKPSLPVVRVHRSFFFLPSFSLSLSFWISTFPPLSRNALSLYFPRIHSQVLLRVFVVFFLWSIPAWHGHACSRYVAHVRSASAHLFSALSDPFCLLAQGFLLNRRTISLLVSKIFMLESLPTEFGLRRQSAVKRFLPWITPIQCWGFQTSRTLTPFSPSIHSAFSTTVLRSPLIPTPVFDLACALTRISGLALLTTSPLPTLNLLVVT